ncbi:MAG: radical SAM protein [Candidatus Tectomicrobia bacterium]|uniref:Radical SAM protein n=1 Tax=Tectimicrobiota bacterium TaxID=2528274 RepID=A0A932FWT7_UNCTE|nr:radical SAM protein [Candidatus Tectomicrobia bacterium]
MENRQDSQVVGLWATPTMVAYEAKYAPHHLTIETTGRCVGACVYCYSSSTPDSGQVMPAEKVFELIDEGVELGVNGIVWHGGDPITHPRWDDFMGYAADRGLVNVCILVNPMSFTRARSRRLTELPLESVVVHIDAIDQAIYDQVHTAPQTLQQKLKGHRTLLEAGFPPEKTIGCITLTHQTASCVEQTIDYFVDEMKASFVEFVTFKTVGFAANRGLDHLEPTLEEVRRALEYRAQKLNAPDLLRIGCSDGRHLCRGYILIKDDGAVTPCCLLQDLVVGNVYEERLSEIFRKHRQLLLYDFEIQGPCGECENNDVCIGCRANAHYYLGDIQASDPKCWLNPTSRQGPYLESKG